jgi:hypothetical protein
MVVTFQIDVLWVVTLCSVVVEYQHIRGPFCIHLEAEVAGVGETAQIQAWTGRGPKVPLANRKCRGNDMAATGCLVAVTTNSLPPHTSSTGCYWPVAPATPFQSGPVYMPFSSTLSTSS